MNDLTLSEGYEQTAKRTWNIRFDLPFIYSQYN
jgi:hypothetical protein